MPRDDSGNIVFEAGTGLKQQALLVSRLMGMSMGEYMRFTLYRSVLSDLSELPARHLILRPGALVYTSPAPGLYVPTLRGLGGERVWMLGAATDLPASVDSLGGYGYFCDITRGDVPGGIEGRAVFVRSTDVGAPERRLRQIVPPPSKSEVSD